FRPWHGGRPTPAGRKILFDWVIVIGILLFIGFATKLSEEFSRKVMMTWFVVTPLVLIGAHVFARSMVHRMVVRGTGGGSMVIVGANALGFRLAKKVADDPYFGVEVKGFFDDRSPARLEGAGGALLLGTLDAMPQWVREHSVSTIYITLPM